MSSQSVTTYSPAHLEEAREEIIPGDVVAITHGANRREGLVVGSHVDYLGREIVEVQMDGGDVYNAWYPHVTRVRRVVSYHRPSYLLPKQRTVERRIYY